MLADRYFSGWFDLALLCARGVDMVVRKHQLRHTDFRTAGDWAKDDHLVRWRKPQRPKLDVARDLCGSARRVDACAKCACG